MFTFFSATISMFISFALSSIMCSKAVLSSLLVSSYMRMPVLAELKRKDDQFFFYEIMLIWFMLYLRQRWLLK